VAYPSAGARPEEVIQEYTSEGTADLWGLIIFALVLVKATVVVAHTMEMLNQISNQVSCFVIYLQLNHKRVW